MKSFKCSDKIIMVRGLNFTAILITIFFVFSSFSQASSGITYHGRILRSDDTPVNSVTTQFRIQVRTPGAENCLLWEEQQTKDLSSTNGTFTITINDTNEPSLIANTLPFGIDRIFSNRTTFTGLTGCSAGTTYNPNTVDGRSLVVFFRENGASPWEQIPATKINYVPSSLNSLQLAGFAPTEFLKIDPAASQTPLTIAEVNTLLQVIAGTSALYLKTGDTVTGDLGGSYGATVVDGIQGVGVAATAPTLNQVLKYNGTQWAPANEGVPGDASYAAKGVVQFDTNLATSGINITAGVVSLPNTITAGGPTGNTNTIPVITYDAKGRLTTVTTATVDDTTKLSLDGSDTMTGALNMGNQNITNVNSVSSTGVGTRTLTIYDADNSNYATLQVPSVLAANYALTLPADDGTAGQVLTTDGNGVLSWSAAGGGGSGDILNGGNTTGAAVTIGTNDNFNLNFETNNITGMTLDNLGQVGIGTTSPTAKLHVSNGDLMVDWDIVANGSIHANDGFASTTGFGFYSDQDTGLFRPTSNTIGISTGGVERLRIGSTGNLGIGTTSPDAKVDISQSSTATSSTVIGHKITQNWSPSAAAMDSAGQFINSTIVSANNFSAAYGQYTSLTYTPTAGLVPDIYGSLVRVTANGSNGGPNGIYGLSATGTYSMSNVSNVKGVEGTGVMSGNGTIGWGYGGDFLYNQTGVGAGTSNGYGVQGRVTASNGIMIRAYGVLTSIARSGGATITDGYGVYIGGVQATNKWSFYASDATAPSYFAGNVGIGTTSPSTLLDINGGMTYRGIATGSAPATAASQGKIYFDSTLNKFRVSENNGAYVDLVGSGGSSSSGTSGHIQFSNGSGGFSSDSNQLFWDSTNNRLGVGTATPAYAIDVVGGVNSDTAFYIGGASYVSSVEASLNNGTSVTFRNSNSTAGSSTNVVGGASDSSFLNLKSTTANGTTDSIRFSVDNNGSIEAMRIINNGNVGVGLTAPTAKLEVRGVNGGGSDMFKVSTSSMAALVVDQWQKVGVGTDTPTAKLDVYNQDGVGAWAGSFVSTDLTSANGIYASTASNSSTDFGLQIAGNAGARNDFVVTAAGNVGVGTTAPSRLLHVAGPMRITASALPGTPATGDIAVDSGDANKLKYYNGSAWVDAGGSGSSGILNGGNSTGAAVTIGTNDNFALNFEVNNSSKLTLDTNNNLTFNGGIALNSNGVAFGSGTSSNWYAMALGRDSIASGSESLATGMETTARSLAQTTIGMRNLDTGTENDGTWVSTDPLFVIGNANFAAPRSNALMIFKNGRSLFNGGTSTAIPAGNAMMSVKGSTTDNTAAVFNATDSSNSSLFYVRNDGNVGLGTNSPSSKLTILTGDIDLQSGSYVTSGSIPYAILTSSKTQSANLFSDTFATAPFMSLGRYSTDKTYFINYENTYGSYSGYKSNHAGAQFGMWTNVPFNNATNFTGFLVKDGSDFRVYTNGALSSLLGVGYNSNYTFNNTSTSGFNLSLVRGRGTWTGATSAIQVGDSIGKISFSGVTSTGFGNSGGNGLGNFGSSIEAAKIQSDADAGTISLSNVPGNLTFWTKPDGSAIAERMRVTSTGNVGIGTTNPSSRLEVSGDIALSNGAARTIKIADTSGAAGQNLTIQAGRATSMGFNSGSLTLSAADAAALGAGSGGNLTLNAGNGGAAGAGGSVSIMSGFSFNAGAPVSIIAGASSNGVGGDVNITAASGGTLGGNVNISAGDGGSGNGGDVFINGGSSITIDGDIILANLRGNVGIGITNPSHILHINGAGRSTQASWDTTSDIRLKDIQGKYQYGLDEILKLNTVWFNYKKDNPLSLPSDKKISGVIAQELQSVMPEAVTENEDGYLTINSDPVHWATVNAVQELYGQCKMSESQINQIKRDVASLKNQIKTKADQSEIEKLKQEIKSRDEIIKSLEKRLKSIEEKLN